MERSVEERDKKELESRGGARRVEEVERLMEESRGMQPQPKASSMSRRQGYALHLLQREQGQANTWSPASGSKSVGIHPEVLAITSCLFVPAAMGS